MVGKGIPRGMYRLGWVILACCLSVVAGADNGSDTIKKVVPLIQAWSTNPILVSAVQAQNAQRQSWEAIKALDNAWIKAPQDDAFIASLMDNPAAQELQKLAKAQPYFTELILMDNQGANVAITHRTTDYWQGDEAKFLETFPKGPQAIHKSRAEYDASVRAYVVQVSVPIVDLGQLMDLEQKAVLEQKADQGKNIGALTVNIILKAIP